MSTRLLAVLLVAAVGLGCSSRTLTLVCVEPDYIDPPTTEIVRTSAAAEWWQDEHRRVHLVFRDAGGPLGDFVLHATADQPFNGVAANLFVTPGDLSASFESAGVAHQLTGLRGVLGVRQTGADLVGSLRVIVQHRRYDRIADAWSRPARYAIFGTFSATRRAPGDRPVVTDIVQPDAELAGDPSSTQPAEAHSPALPPPGI